MIGAVLLAVGTWALGAFALVGAGFVFWWTMWGIERVWAHVPEKWSERLGMAWAIPLFIAVMTLGVWAIGDGLRQALQPASHQERGPTPEADKETT